MLVIRQEQWDAFRDLPARNFEDRMVRHVRTHWSYECDGAGPEAVREFVRLGIARARKHGFDAERGTALYLGLMMMLGADFDRDPQLPEFRAELDRDDVDDPWSQILGLHERALAFLDATCGDDGRALAKALVRLETADPDELLARAEGDDEVARMIVAATSIYPEKCAALGPSVLIATLVDAVSRADAAGLAAPGHRLVYVLCGLFLGCGFEHDPLQRWAAEALRPRHEDEPADVRGARLVEAARAHVAWSLANE